MLSNDLPSGLTSYVVAQSSGNAAPPTGDWSSLPQPVKDEFLNQQGPGILAVPTVAYKFPASVTGSTDLWGVRDYPPGGPTVHDDHLTLMKGDGSIVGYLNAGYSWTDAAPGAHSAPPAPPSPVAL
jgi:hypothetical protein